MSVEGELGDFELSRLLELFCLQRRRLVIWLNHAGEEGAVFVEDGQVIHASLGTLQGELQGEEAAYRMLGWTGGSFRIAQSASKVPTTIEVAWNHLLLEGARRVDEQHLGRSAELPEAGEQTAENLGDEAWMLELLTLASRLERVLDAIRARSGRRQPTLVLEKLEELIGRTVDFGQSHDLFDHQGAPLRDFLAAAETRWPELRAARLLGGRLAMGPAIGSYGREPDQARRRARGRELSDGLVELLSRCLETLGSGFGSSTLASEWTEVYTVFVGDITESCRRVRF